MVDFGFYCVPHKEQQSAVSLEISDVPILCLDYRR